MTIGQTTYRSVAELAHGKAPSNPIFNRIFKIAAFHPACVATPELEQKYGVAIDNVQEVISIQNVVTADLTWWNPARKTKPQNFKASATAVVDPTGGGGPGACDFCDWPTKTAADTWGRVERPHAVSASNLFKYGAPAQGVILFKHHDSPLNFNFDQLSDALTVADGWFEKSTSAAVADGHSIDQLHPLLVWNALARAGASQFHGHLQTMLSAAPLPTQTREKAAAQAYAAAYQGSSYYNDLVAACAAVGLARRVTAPLGGARPASWGSITPEEAVSIGYQGTGVGSGCATVHASLCPTKDAELTVQGASLCCPAFQLAFYAALRALIDGLGVQSFNAGVYNMPLAAAAAGGNSAAPVVAKVVSRGRLTAAASDYGGLEVFAGATIGHTSPWDSLKAFEGALAAAGAEVAEAKKDRAGRRIT